MAGKYDPDELRDNLLNSVFGGGSSRPQKVFNEDGSVDIAAIKHNLERDIFDVLAKYDISREKATHAVANFMQNLNRLKF